MITELSHPLTRRPSTARRASRRRAGFSFTEVLFAVMVLGIGFIMIAAIFPVTIRQTQASVEDTMGTTVGGGAVQFLQSIATSDLFPPTAKQIGESAPVYSLSDITNEPPVWLAARGNYIFPDNPQLAWIPLYRRGLNADGTPAPYAQVFIWCVRSRNRDQYYLVPPASGGANDIEPYNASTPATLEPMQCEVSLAYKNNLGVMRSELTFNTGNAQNKAGPGAFVIIADDKLSGTNAGTANGRIYQLGNYDEQKGVWELIPGADMINAGKTGGDQPLNNAKAYIVGRGYTDPSNPSVGNYGGPVQDVAVYTAFIRVPEAPPSLGP